MAAPIEYKYRFTVYKCEYEYEFDAINTGDQRQVSIIHEIAKYGRTVLGGQQLRDAIESHCVFHNPKRERAIPCMSLAHTSGYE